MIEKMLDVEGMSCAHCKAAVEGELRALPGIEKADADVARGIVEVRYDESKVGTEDLERAIEEAGYTVAA
jgi:copper chaperone